METWARPSLMITPSPLSTPPQNMWPISWAKAAAKKYPSGIIAGGKKTNPSQPPPPADPSRSWGISTSEKLSSRKPP